MWFRTITLAAALSAGACQTTDNSRKPSGDPIENPPLKAKTESGSTYTVKMDQPVDPAAKQKRFVGASVDVFGAT